jgi:hypothetical protein
METEIWKDIPNYEGRYQISNLGRLKSLGNNKQRKEKVIKPGSVKGYMCVTLIVNAKKEYFYIHQLVAMAFLEFKRCGHKYEVDHINNIKHDNRLENLQILTHKDNTNKNPCKSVREYQIRNGINYKVNPIKKIV